jgi:hypothetical protein
MYTTRAHSTSRKTAAKGVDGGRRLFLKFQPPIHHRPSEQRVVLGRTVSELCVVTRRLVSGRKERTSYDLFAANGSPIPTYGWQTLTLNLGLRRDFTWRFVVADV